MQRHHPEAGIAIGPILFVIALLGVLAAVMASGSGGMGTAIKADSITPVLHTQANLIRNKMFECNTIRSVWPTSDTNGTTIADVECSGDPSGQRNLWTGARPTPLAPPPKDFDDWIYYDKSGSGGGRCIMIKPSSTSLAANASFKQGIAKAYEKFTSQEAAYSSGGTNQKLIIWITRPTGSPDALCTAS